MEIRNGKLWERGGGATSGGTATVVALADGAPARPGRVDRQQAEFVAEGGMLVIEVYRSRDQYTTSMGRVRPDLSGIESVPYEERVIPGGFSVYIDGKHVADSQESGWINVDQQALLDAISAAWAKSRCYHCRCVHYVAKAPSRR